MGAVKRKKQRGDNGGEEGGGRRRFLKQAGLAAMGAAVVGALQARRGTSATEKTQAPTQGSLKYGEASLPALENEQESLILRMQRELQRALKKPLEDRRWVMVIDLKKCIGCSACTLACNAENNLPPGVVYRPVLEEEVGEYPNVRKRFLPRLCNQCDNPPCVPVCPVDATYMRPDGVVEIDYNQCIGCRYCLTACPYSARTSDFGDFYTKDTPELQPYEKRPSFEYGRKWIRKKGQSPVGNARKCHFCLHRLDVGMLPACVTGCVGYATFFGDANDHESLVSELIGSPRVMRLKEELGTEPKVYYLL